MPQEDLSYLTAEHLLKKEVSPEKEVTQNEASYIKDSNKVKNICILNDALLVTADLVGLNPTIPHEIGLKAIRNASERNTSWKPY